MDINSAALLANPFLALAFSEPQYASLLPGFIDKAKQGQAMPVAVLLHDLLALSASYCGVSITYRTLAYDFAGAVLDAHEELWKEQEREDGYATIGLHLEMYYPEDDGRLADADVAVLSYGEYLAATMHILLSDELSEESKPAFCFAAYCFFERDAFLFDEDEREEMLHALRD